MAHPGDVLRSRPTEAMLWRGAMALGGDAAAADAALAEVLRQTSAPNRASESRLLRVVISTVARTMGALEPHEALRRLVREGGVPGAVARSALGIDGAAEPGAAPEAAHRLSDADVAAALARVDAMTAGIRRRRLAINVLKFGLFGVALLLVVYVMFDLRRAAEDERAGRTPGDVYSLPMPKGNGAAR